jgi:hypothetical protein
VIARVAGVLALAIALAGCAAFARDSSSRSASSATRGDDPIARAQRTHEYGPPSHRQSAGGRAPTAVAAIAAFATGYINWSAPTIARTMRALGTMSIGQARSEVALTASRSAQDYELRRAGMANSGVVEAIAPVLGQRNQYAVVTRERTTASNDGAYQGLPPAWHLTLATVTKLSDAGWVVSGWLPEN